REPVRADPVGVRRQIEGDLLPLRRLELELDAAGFDQASALGVAVGTREIDQRGLKEEERDDERQAEQQDDGRHRSDGLHGDSWKLEVVSWKLGGRLRYFQLS